ncbi:MAG: MBL fold metallo-hydrolase [Nitrososphaerota archaeon]
MIKVVVLGSGSIVPTQNRFATSIYIDAGVDKFLLDCGPGTIERMRRAKINAWKIGQILLSHFHIDHTADLLPFIKLRAYNEEGKIAINPPTLKIYGPIGLMSFIEHAINQNKYLRYLSDIIGYLRYVELYEMDENLIKEQGDLKISCKKVKHESGIMYRLDIKDKVIVYSGDTAFNPEIAVFANNADLLIHECSCPKQSMIGEHTSEVDLSEIISLAKPKRVIITHLYPVWNGLEEELVRKISDKHKCRIYVAHDMLEINL